MKQIIEFFKKDSDQFEALRKELRLKIKLARKNALPELGYTLGEGRKFFQRLSNLRNKSNKADRDFEELIRVFKQSQAAQISVDTLTKFKILLEEVGNDKNEVMSTLEHENAHMNITEQEKEYLGDLKYCLTAYKSQNDSYFIPSVRYSFKGNGDQNDSLDYMLSSLRSLQAPDQYGHRMSAGDIEDFNNFQQLIKNYTKKAKEGKNSNITEIAGKIDKYDRLIKEKLVPNPEKNTKIELGKIKDDLML